jgi:hypothetical protein
MNSSNHCFRTVIRFLFPLLVSLTAPAGAAAQINQGPTPSATPAPTPKSTVRGRVVYDDTEHPVRRAEISLTQIPDRGNMKSATDRQGRFTIKNVPAGTYYVSAKTKGKERQIKSMS